MVSYNLFIPLDSTWDTGVPDCKNPKLVYLSDQSQHQLELIEPLNWK